MMQLENFLQLLAKDATENPSQLIPFTEEMDREWELLLQGVEVDGSEIEIIEVKEP